jgi:hypothetical protein|nr:MAG TPA: tail protein [Caudoviricetes sp.]
MTTTVDIHSINGNSNTVVLESSSVRHVELMSKDYVRLVFSTDKKININVGDYVSFSEYGTFYIADPQKGTYNKSTGGYDYDLQFNAPYFLWKNKIYKFNPGKEGKNETTWSLTGTLQEHMAVFLENLKEYGYSYEVEDSIYNDDSSHRVVYIQFDKTNLFDALTQIADKFSYEWAVGGSQIVFGNIIRDDFTPAVGLTMGDNVEDMSAQDSNNDAVNRYYVFGSTRNIPKGYRQKGTGIVMNGIVQKRLMLPEGTPYIDLRGGMKPDEVVEGVLVIDDIYPRTKSKVATVTTVKKDMETTDAAAQQQPTEPSGTGTTGATSGNTTDGKKTERVNVYRFTTNDFTFSKDYILSGQTLQVQFQSGSLNGMTFDVAFNPEGASEKVAKKDENGKEIAGETESNSEAQVFELVRNDTYGITLPNDAIHPATDDTFVLLGWDANKMPEWKELVTKAEKELDDRARTYISSREADPLTYTCTMMSDWMYGLNGEGKQDANFTKVNTFYLGLRVNLNNEAFFGGERQSRVVGYEYKLDIPYDGAKIFCGESAFYSKNKATQSAISEVKESILNHQGDGGGNGGGNIRLIRSSDRVTPASDSTAYSSLRSDMDFAHKRKNDSISALWTFKNGYGARRGLQTYEYENKTNEDNLFGSGFELIERTNSNGAKRTRLEVDELLVRVKAFFAELEIRKISYVGGNYLFSSAGGKIYFVEWLDAAGNVLDKGTHQASEAFTFRCYLYSDNGTTATMNYFAENDQVICKTFNIDEGVHKNVSNKYYWRRATGTGKGSIAALSDKTEYQYVDISMNDCDEKSDYPEANDTIVQLGNWSNSARQGAIYLMVEGESAPAIMEYSDLGADGKHFMLTKPTLQLSPKGNIIYGEFHSVNGSTKDDGSKSIDEQIAALLQRIEEIQAQADKKFDIYFEGGAPRPLKGEDFSTANYPANEWIIDALKELHVQDLYYDTDIAPASDGGRAWRWVSESSTGADGATTRTYYWEVVTDQDTLSALEKARDLQNQVDDIVSDGIISRGSEKSDLLIEWHKAASNYEKYKEQADDYSLLSDTVWESYREKFFAVATMLNDGTTYTEKNLTDGLTPAWLNVTVDTVLADTPTKNAATYRNTWNDCYAAFAAVLKLISAKAKELADNAQKSADEANSAIDDIVSDGKLDPSEKITVKRDFLAFYHELTDDNGLKDKGQDENGKFYTDGIETAYDKVVGCFNEVGTLLNGSVSWAFGAVLDEDNLPVWLRNPPLVMTPADKNEYITVTSSIDADTFRSKWSAMYAAKSAYIALLSEYAKGLADNAQKSADEKVQTFVTETLPKPPYKTGDFWIQTGNGNNMMICTTGRESGQGDLSDWTDLSDLANKSNARIQLAMLGDKIYDLSGGYIQNNGKISIVFSANQPASSTDGDLWFDGEKLKRYVSSWEKIKSDTYARAFKTVFDIVGQQTLTCFNAVQTQNMKLYDLVLRTISWHDPFKDEDVEGNVEVLMYNGKDWETLKECTRTIIDNLGDEIRTVVFGSDGKGATDASGLVTRTMFNELFSEKVKTGANGYITNIDKSGLVTTSNFATLFSESLSADGTVVKRSEMSVYVTKDENGYVSNAKITADNIILEGLVTVNNNFKVLTDGTIEAVNANISGTINATKGKIGAFSIDENGLYSGTKQSITGWYNTWKSGGKEDMAYLNTQTLFLQTAIGYSRPGDIANTKVGIGLHADPDEEANTMYGGGYAKSVGYFYRNMNSFDDIYYPAVKIISDNVFNRDIALRVVGGVQVYGGIMEIGHSMEYTKMGDTNALDLSFGTKFLLYTSLSTNPSFFLPKLSDLRKQLGITSISQPFCVRVSITARRDSNFFYIATTYRAANASTLAEGGILINNDGDEWGGSQKKMGPSDCVVFDLCYSTATGYYAQLVSIQG